MLPQKGDDCRGQADALFLYTSCLLLRYQRKGQGLREKACLKENNHLSLEVIHCLGATS